jgi:hypothetical protein
MQATPPGPAWPTMRRSTYVPMLRPAWPANVLPTLAWPTNAPPIPAAMWLSTRKHSTRPGPPCAGRGYPPLFPFRIVWTNGKLCIAGLPDSVRSNTDHTWLTYMDQEISFKTSICLSLLVRKWGSTFLHLVCDVPHSTVAGPFKFNVHCGKNFRIFRDAADQTLPVTEFSEIYYRKMKFSYPSRNITLQVTFGLLHL